MTSGLVICGLNLIKQSNGIPLRFAILKSVSPERIVYSVPPGGQGTGVGTQAEAGGTQMTWPGEITFGSVIWGLNRSKQSTVIPKRLAILNKVSPGLTV